jgi:predicted metal-binding protein
MITIFIVDFSPSNQNVRRQFFEIWNKAIKSMNNETQNIILYRHKLLIEQQFLSNTTKKTKELEKEQFENRSEYDKIVLEGFCNRCEQSNLVKWPIHQYKMLLINNIDENNNLFFDCKKCNTTNSCIIPLFQQTLL